MALGLSGIVKVTAKFSWNAAVDVINVYHYLHDVHVVSVNLTNLFAAIQTKMNEIYDPLKTHLPGGLDAISLKLDRVIWDVSTAKEVVAENLIEGPWVIGAAAPTGAGETLPTQCALSVWMRTVRPKSRGRKFFGPVIEGSSGDGGSVSAALQTALGTTLAEMLEVVTDSDSNQYRPGIITPYGMADYFYAFKNGGGNVRFCTRRSRRFGVGT